jgi:hypothetical protein
MKKTGIPVKGLKLKDGKLVKSPAYTSVTEKIRQKKSKRQKAVRRGQI